MNPTIIKYEHEYLRIGERVFEKRHWDLLCALNERHGDKYFRVLRNGIQFKSYVGVLQLEDLTIEIFPKIDRSNNANAWRSVLMEMLEKAGRLKTKPINRAQVEKGKVNLIQLYFQLYLNELEKLIHKGIIKQYRKDTKNIKALKGKLEFAKNIQHNSIHKERFYTTHQVYDQNHLLNQTLRYTLMLIKRFGKGTSLYTQSAKLDLSLHTVKEKIITKSELERIKLNRKTQPYADALELARLIILNYSPNLAVGKENMLSLLFDMNRLWEDYLRAILQRSSPKHQIKVCQPQHLFFWRSNTLNPDIVLEKNGHHYIIDAKWKLPEKDLPSSHDIRQIYAYCRKWKAKKGMLLYPEKTSIQKFAPFEIDEFDQDGKKFVHSCKMSYISVLDENGKLDPKIGDTILKEMELIT